MPSTRLTIISNASQNIRSTLLLPATSDLRSSVLSLAKSKLRLKKPTRIFLPGGQELATSDSISAVLADDLKLLISSGEEYVGNIAAAPRNGGDVRVVAEDIFIDRNAVAQLEACARLPGVLDAVGLPDLHPGGKFPVGCSFVSEGYLHPPLIGGDIGCGMSWYRVNMRASIMDDATGMKRVAESLRGLEGEWAGTDERGWWLGDATAGEEWDRSVGTIGSGNHFAEVQVVEEAEGNGEYGGMKEGDVVLLVHSGSRGFGQDVLAKFWTGDDSISLHESDPRAQEYLRLHDKACAWARRSRELIALRFLQCLEGDVWAIPGAPSQERILQTQKSLAERNILDIHHNNVTVTLWPPSPTEEPQRNVYIHRKGAAPATLSTPFLPLPGSRGTPTLILLPLFQPSTGHGAKNALSLAHGAGRAMSRGKARTGIAGKYGGDVKVLTEMKPMNKKRGGKGGVAVGGYVVCDNQELVWEEAVEAYKDVEVVGKDLEKCGVARVVGRCVPRVTYKVRNEHQGGGRSGRTDGGERRFVS